MTSHLKLHEEDYQRLREHIDNNPDVEVCGLLGGIWKPYPKVAIAETVIAIANVAKHPTVQYYMAEDEQVRAMVHFSKQGLETIGIYHSHPDGNPVPSTTDIRDAMYPDAVYVIGVPKGGIRAWRIVREKVSEAQIVVF